MEDEYVEATSWSITREGFIIKRHLAGGRIKYQLLVRDRGREKFFIEQWFKYEEQAREFLEKLKMEVTG